MSKTFHRHLKTYAQYRASMLVEVFVNQVFSEDDVKNLIANMQRGFFESTMNIADAAYQVAINEKKIADIGGYLYDQVTQETPDHLIARSAVRAVSFIKFGETVTEDIAKDAVDAIETEMEYLLLRAIEPFYTRFPTAT